MSAHLTVPDMFWPLLQSMVATLATQGKTGDRQLTALAFLYNEANGRIKLSLNDTRQKPKNLRRD